MILLCSRLGEDISCRPMLEVIANGMLETEKDPRLAASQSLGPSGSSDAMRQVRLSLSVKVVDP